MRKKVSKYRNKKMDGFDSKKEAKRAAELRLMEKAGKIEGLKRQQKFELLPSQKDKNGRVVERAVTWTADFVYLDCDGMLVVEDVKSPATRTQQYILRRKMMLWFHGIRIREI